jgi:hypothetical protein
MTLSLALTVLLGLAVAAPQSSGVDRPAASMLPELNRVRGVTLSPSYSCRPKEEFARGYEGTALFLSETSRAHNTPDLLFNGACGSNNYFQVATSGGDLGMIADIGLGKSLAGLTEERALNYAGVAGGEMDTRFAPSAYVATGHTYVVILNRHEVRGLYALTVTKFEPDRRVEFSYVVLSYATQGPIEESK